MKNCVKPPDAKPRIKAPGKNLRLGVSSPEQCWRAAVMNWKYVILLVVGWVVYIGIGGAIFHRTETGYEKKVTEEIYNRKKEFMSKWTREGA